MNRLVEEQPAGRAAGLALPGEVHAGDGTVGRLVEVDVGEHDHRVLAAQFKRDHLDRDFGGGALDRHAGLDRADEGEPLDLRMAYQRIAGLGTEPGDDIDHARRQHAGAFLAEDGGGQWALLGGFDDDGVAGHQRRRHLGDGEHHRMVERDDAPDHAIGLAHGEMQVARRRGHRGALQFVGQARVITQRVAAEPDVEAHLGDGIAGVHHLDLEDLLAALQHRVGELVEIVAALGGRQALPGRLRFRRSLVGPLDVFLVAARHRADHLLGGGIDRLEPLAARAGDHLAADQHLALAQGQFRHGDCSIHDHLFDEG